MVCSIGTMVQLEQTNLRSRQRYDFTYTNTTHDSWLSNMAVGSGDALSWCASDLISLTIYLILLAYFVLRLKKFLTRRLGAERCSADEECNYHQLELEQLEKLSSIIADWIREKRQELEIPDDDPDKDEELDDLTSAVEKQDRIQKSENLLQLFASHLSRNEYIAGQTTEMLEYTWDLLSFLTMELEEAKEKEKLLIQLHKSQSELMDLRLCRLAISDYQCIVRAITANRSVRNLVEMNQWISDNLRKVSQECEMWRQTFRNKLLKEKMSEVCSVKQEEEGGGKDKPDCKADPEILLPSPTELYPKTEQRGEDIRTLWNQISDQLDDIVSGIGAIRLKVSMADMAEPACMNDEVPIRQDSTSSKPMQ